MSTAAHPLSRVGSTLLLTALLASCAKPSDDATPVARSGPPVVHTVNYPLAYFAERIGGEHLDVRFLATPGEDPAFWSPGDDDIRQLQAADLILLNGAEYARWRNHVSLPDARTVDTGLAFADTLITTQAAATHSHGPAGDHSHTGVAFTTWLDFQQARQQAEAVRDALGGLVPEASGEIDANAAVLMGELDRLDGELVAAAAAVGPRPLVASHPVYQYLARRYGLSIESVRWEPETVPDDAAMAELQAVLADHPAQWMIWEGTPATDSVARLEAIGVRSVVFDPCGNRPDDGDWLTVMQRNVQNLQAID